MSYKLAPLALTIAVLALPGCIDRDRPEDDGGGGGGGGGETPIACGRLPTAVTQYKGGDTLGEELTLTLDPATLAYRLRIDASLQRSAGSEFSGTLVPLDGCTYTSEEAGAVFTLGDGGVALGGVRDVDASRFVPMLAFSTWFENSAAPTVFNDVASIYNGIGTPMVAGAIGTYAGGSGRIRNAGTFQLCTDAGSGFVTYDAACAQTAKGYLSYNADRSAFDVYTTPASGGAVTSGGTLSGSMVIGKVGALVVPLQMLRESSSFYGLRLFTPQSSLSADGADGDYASLDSTSINGGAVWSGTTLARNGASATLSFDAPAAGVVRADGAYSGYLLYNAGLYGFVPSATAAPSLELGLRD